MNNFNLLMNDSDFRACIGDYEIAINTNNFPVANDIRDWVLATFNYDLNF